MKGLFYSTGQVARQLGATQATIRVLCESGLITAETTPGRQWRVPSSEVERLKRDGVPLIPRHLPTESTQLVRSAMAGRQSEPKSVEVALAADQVAITKSLLERRKLDREVEENEDWFRARERQEAEGEATERERAAAEDGERRRLVWEQAWMQYALDSIPWAARREVEMEVHTLVQEVLSKLHPDHPRAVVERLVDAAVHRALRPWNRNQEVERSLKAGMNTLPWDVQYRSEYAAVKQRAWETAVAAVEKLREEASYDEMEAAAVQAVQPIILAYQHHQACQRVVTGVYIFDATSEETEAARGAVRKAVAALPIGADARQLDRAEETALAPYKAGVAKRKEAARLESERQDKRRATRWKVDGHLGHIEKYLEEEYEFKGGYWEMLRERDRLRPLIREALIDELLEDPDMTEDEILESIEGKVDDHL